MRRVFTPVDFNILDVKYVYTTLTSLAVKTADVSEIATS